MLTVKVEIGDDVMTLTPIEARTLQQSMAGYGANDALIAAMRDHHARTAELSDKVDRLERQLISFKHMEAGRSAKTARSRPSKTEPEHQ